MVFNFITPETLFDNHYHAILDLVATHSPFPRAKSDLFSKPAKTRAARIHFEETVFFGQVVFNDLEPKKTVEVCAGFGIPSITLKKLFGVKSSCVDNDPGKMAVGALISQKLGIDLTWEHRDLFLYLRHHAQELKGATLLATAAYCQDKKKGRPRGSGERDLVLFAQKNQMDIALLPYRTGDIISTGVSSEKKRFEEYEKILTNAGYKVKKHSTEVLFRGQGSPDWFFIDILTAKCIS
jgi:hypothetical protein